MLFYDFEVFEHDWLVVLIDLDAKEETVIVNDADALTAFYEAHRTDIWTGFNNIHYDQYILKAILLGMNPKVVSDFIITSDKKGYTFSQAFRKVFTIQYDVKLGTDRSLKVYEGFMGNSIKESSVPFDIDRKLTVAELDDSIGYCHHDVCQTIEMFIRRQDEFNASMFFIKHFGYPLADLSLTKAQLSAKMLGGNRKGRTFGDEFGFKILDCIRLKKYKHIADWYMKPENHDYKKKQEHIVAGVPHTFSWGGGHGAIPKYHGTGVFILADATAYYPSLQKLNSIGYRVMDSPKNFEFIHDSNVEFKRLGDKKKRQPFKIFDNAISGQMKQASSALYDPMSNNTICINGQLLLLDLVEHLEPYVDLIQNNTDGICIKVRNYERDFDLIDDIVYEFEQRTGVTIDFDVFFGDMYQKDVNNYLLIDRENGNMKVKGSYIKKLSDLDYDLPIVNKSLTDYMVKGIPVEQTILTCDSLKEFQMIKSISRKYKHLKHGQNVLKEKTVRVFASKNMNDGGLSKLHVDKTKYDKVENTPEHCFIFNGSVNGKKCPDSLDKNWYVSLAKKRLGGFGV